MRKEWETVSGFRFADTGTMRYIGDISNSAICRIDKKE